MRKHAAARRVEVVELAASGASPKMIAASLGLSDRQVRHYLNDPTTASELRQLQDDRLKALTRRALDGAGVALSVLRTVAEDAEQPGMSRVHAARALLDAAIRLVEVTGVAERLDNLEAWAEALTGEEPAGGRAQRWRRTG